LAGDDGLLTAPRRGRYIAEVAAREGTKSRAAPSHRLATVTAMVTCPGGLIVHADGTVAGRTDEEDGCCGRELRHEGDPISCWVRTLAGCKHRGVQANG